MDLAHLQRIFSHCSDQDLMGLLSICAPDEDACVKWMEHLSVHQGYSATYVEQTLAHNEVFVDILQKALVNQKWDFIDRLRHASLKEMQEEDHLRGITSFNKALLLALVQFNHPVETYRAALQLDPALDENHYPRLGQFPCNAYYWQWMNEVFENPWPEYINRPKEYASMALCNAARLHPVALEQALSAMPDPSQNQHSAQQYAAILGMAFTKALDRDDEGWEAAKALARVPLPMSLTSLQSAQLKSLAQCLRRFGPDEGIKNLLETTPISKSLSDFAWKEGPNDHLSTLHQAGIDLSRLQTQSGIPFLHLLGRGKKSILQKKSLLLWCLAQAPYLLDCANTEGVPLQEVLLNASSHAEEWERTVHAQMQALCMEITSDPAIARPRPRL